MDDQARRAQRASANLRALTPPEVSHAPASVTALRNGAALLWHNPYADATAWAGSLDTVGLPDAVRAPHATLVAGFAGTPAIVALAEAAEAAARDVSLSNDVCERCEEIGSRGRLLATWLGHYPSALVAMHEADLAAGATVDDAERRLLLTTRAELSYVAHLILQGTYDAKRDAVRTEVRRIVWGDLSAEGELVQFWQSLDRPRGAVRDDTGHDPRDFAPDWLEDDFISDLETARAARRTEGLVVIRSVEHLPGSAKDGARPTGSGTTPRSEFASLAGVRLPCVPPADLPAVRARLVSRYPHAAAVIDRILLLAVGQPYARLRPVLLVGPPGCGKTRLARDICEAMGLAVTVYSCAGVADSSLIGTSRQWGTGRASVPLQAIKREMTATVAIVVDEVDKVGTSRLNGNAQDGLLSMLDHAGRYHDPYLECDANLAGVTFIATANGVSTVTDPLRDRFLILEMPAPTRESLPALIEGILEDLREETGQDMAWLPGLDGEELAAVLANHRPGSSIRSLRRLVEAAVASRAVLSPRH